MLKQQLETSGEPIKVESLEWKHSQTILESPFSVAASQFAFFVSLVKPVTPIDVSLFASAYCKKIDSIFHYVNNGERSKTLDHSKLDASEVKD